MKMNKLQLIKLFASFFNNKKNLFLLKLSLLLSVFNMLRCESKKKLEFYDDQTKIYSQTCASIFDICYENCIFI